MENPNGPSLEERRIFAAQNARDGLITVADLSLLTGVDVSRLNGFAKKGFLGHYGEYHGKRLFNFQEIVDWVHAPGESDEARMLIRTTLESFMKSPVCPFLLEPDKGPDGRVRISWTDTSSTPSPSH